MVLVSFIWSRNTLTKVNNGVYLVHIPVRMDKPKGRHGDVSKPEFKNNAIKYLIIRVKLYVLELLSQNK